MKHFKYVFSSLSLSLIVSIFALNAFADPLTDRLDSGKKLRLGYAVSVPWAFTTEDGKPTGFVNDLTLLALAEMGIPAENVEGHVVEWAGLIPGIQARRYDLITGGMYILKSRCENINFSNPIGIFGDAFMVPAGNPKGINNYQDVIRTGATLATGAGFNTVEAAKREGVPDSQMLLVAGEMEVLAAVMAGRADAGVMTHAGATAQVEKAGEGKYEVTNPKDLPIWTQNHVGIGFRKTDTDFLERFNTAMLKVIGTKAWMEAGAPHGYTEVQLPSLLGYNEATAYACATK
ncbi:MAG: ectoine/hydroxyectoine ABC transporter substrate-binding protein EhuB [Acidiferrobacteraceae bacterium]|nr:ectoine/hydroxyectoine ABC transporter substrate-binding protein EhuB [Acidiferrobacteraceae bacterium]|tara:strand:+ start:2539 stop:3408 length:870 start_codon:yes stop_codon:yes gene_type:complete